jgi:single-strand DNA-binding protein
MLVGRLTKNPLLRGENNNVCVFTLAVSRAYTNEEGKRDADFIQVKTFKKTAENCSKFLQRGSMVSCEAHIKTDSYLKDGKRVFTMDVIADEVRFLSGKKDSESNNNQNNPNQYQDNRNQIDDDPFPGNSEHNPVGDDDWPF